MSYDFEAETQLLRDVFSTAAHDLGGLSSALALRIDVLGGTVPAADEAALRGIVDELRSLGRQLRVLRGPVGGDTLAPPGARTLADWFGLVERFGRPMLGRGAVLRAELDEGALAWTFAGALGPKRAHALLLALLAYCRAAQARRGDRTVEVTVRARHVSADIVLTIVATWGAGTASRDDGERWLTLAREVVAAAGVTWQHDAETQVSTLHVPG